MAVVVSNFSAPVSSGNFSVTGVGFEPVAVILFTVEQNQGNPSNSYGACTGAGEEFCMWTCMGDEASGYTERHNELRDDRCLVVYSNGSTFVNEQVSATCVSMDADGFTLNFLTPGNAEAIQFVAIGGRNIGEAHAGTFTLGDSIGTTGITGVGFEPNALVVAQTVSTAVNVRSNFMAWGLGFSDGVNQYASYAMGVQGSAVGGHHMHRTDEIACVYNGSAVYRMALDSMDADGFTVDVTDAWAHDIPHGYLAIRAAATTAGNDVQPDSTGVQSFSTPGFRPGGVLFCWNGADTPSTSGASTMPVRPGAGATTVMGDESISMIHRASAPFGAYVPDAYWNIPVSNRCINITGAGSQVDPQVHDAQGWAIGDDLYQGGFDINWTNVTSGADRAFGWLALPGDLPIDWVPSIYRRVM